MPSTGGDIVVTGTRIAELPLFTGLRIGQNIPQLQLQELRDWQMTLQTEDLFDRANLEIKVEPTIILTPERLAAIAQLQSHMEGLRGEGFLQNPVPDNMVAFDGMVTTFETQQIIERVDFRITQFESFANQSWRGEANFNFGNPIISFNIDTLVAYAARPGGIAYLIGHEIGHMTLMGRALNMSGDATASEIFANDFARALGQLQGYLFGFTPTFGYSAVQQFFVEPGESALYYEPESYSRMELAYISPDGIPTYETTNQSLPQQVITSEYFWQTDLGYF